MEPFYSNNIIGIGESIGTVFPMLGEGIIPSLLCCEIFLKVIEENKDNANKFSKEEYRKRVLKKFHYYHDVYKIIRLKMDGNSMQKHNISLQKHKTLVK